jgi:secondary thiamine-phosphate synthase enzyme
MAAESHQFKVATRGNTHVVNITDEVQACVGRSSISCGIATVFAIGSTAGITTTEYEPGLVNRDLKVAFEGIAPENATYLHEQTWHDDNGHSHVRASLLGPSLAVPVVDGRVQLGTWQQIIFIDFDTRARNRQVLVQIIGE